MKWCNHCRKADHNDAECWSTRAVPVGATPDPMRGLSLGKLVPPMPESSMAQKLREAAVFQCGCVGPQNGQPLCPCQMRSVQIKNGRYVRIQDLGPAPE